MSIRFAERKSCWAVELDAQTRLQEAAEMLQTAETDCMQRRGSGREGDAEARVFMCPVWTISSSPFGFQSEFPLGGVMFPGDKRHPDLKLNKFAENSPVLVPPSTYGESIIWTHD